MKGNIFFCGDLHGKFSYLIAAVLQHKPDAVVLLGDIMGDFAERSLDQELAAILDKTEIWWIHVTSVAVQESASISNPRSFSTHEESLPEI